MKHKFTDSYTDDGLNEKCMNIPDNSQGITPPCEQDFVSQPQSPVNAQDNMNNSKTNQTSEINNQKQVSGEDKLKNRGGNVAHHSSQNDTKLTREEIEDMKHEDLFEAEREYQEK